MGSPTTQRFAVFRDPENPPESWRSWSAYTRDFNTAWRGFVGFYEGHGATRRERKADAIKRARADNREPMDGIDPTPPAPADDKCWKCGGGVERTNTTLPGCDNDIFHDGQPPALPTEGAHPNGPVEGCPCHLCRYAFGEDSPADDAGGAEALREACAKIVDRFHVPRAMKASIVNGAVANLAAAIRALPLPLPARDAAVEEARNAVLDAVATWRAAEKRIAAAYLRGQIDTATFTKRNDEAAAGELTEIRLASDALDAALRRAHGGPPERSDGGHEAEGRGGA